MLDRYLFRGKGVLSKAWQIGHYFQCMMEHYIRFPKTPKHEVLVDPTTIGQCTGLRDKNGKLIFEGDIIKTKMFGKKVSRGCNMSGYDYFTIVFTDGSFMLDTKERSFTATYIPGKESHYEVVGNIHDNPELLEV